MKITRMAALILMAGSVVRGESPTDEDRRVTACIEGLDARSTSAVLMGRALASRMFAEIGVTIEWRRGFRDCPAQGILISLSSNTPEKLKRGALAYALPFEGRHIRVFIDRIRQSHPAPRVPQVIGHVLVHEITHILEGYPRHSQTGVMKARWTAEDFSLMAMKPLVFEAHDIDEIHHGMVWRARQHAEVATGSKAFQPAGE
jgi:hypothetical protein